MGKGTIFAFVTTGLKYTGETVYRFGHTSKTFERRDVHDRRIFLERLGFNGLHRPQAIVLFEVVHDVSKAWRFVSEHLRSYWKPAQEQPLIKQDPELGDRFFTVEYEKDFGRHVQSVLIPKLHNAGLLGQTATPGLHPRPEFKVSFTYREQENVENN